METLVATTSRENRQQYAGGDWKTKLHNAIGAVVEGLVVRGAVTLEIQTAFVSGCRLTTAHLTSNKRQAVSDRGDVVTVFASVGVTVLHVQENRKISNEIKRM